MTNHEDRPQLSAINQPKNQLKNEGKVKKNRCSGGQEAKQCKSAIPEIFAKIAKISMRLRKFRRFSENFAILAKLEIFARHQDFR